jgi:hypothetical protein
LLTSALAFGQLSPGDLSEGHKHLEGMSNCTECHSIGNKVPDQKCLDCHTEIQSLINDQRGFHFSDEVQSQECIDCHSEHHGRKFDMVRFDQDAFDHRKTGYRLEAAHDRIDCRDCHKPENIADSDIRKLEDTFLGLEEACLSCHDDYHQGTLDKQCTECHNFEAWEPAEKFDHSRADFKLKGAHKDVDCVECHKETEKNGKEFQQFADLQFSRCTDCHEDEHNGRFGKNCTECHNETNWHSLNKGIKFDHTKTDYPLEGLHTGVDCKECHTSDSYTRAIDFSNCKNCHDDYHKGQFTDDDPSADCNDCHTVQKPFTYTLYGLDEHQQSQFPLEGAHLATPCFSCHVSEEEHWEFEAIGERCVDCHDNIHQTKISEKFYPDEDCTQCHNAKTWTEIDFDHNKTDWPLEGQHKEVTCRACHFDEGEDSVTEAQQFQSLSTDCTECHSNVHGDQFEIEGKTDCMRCHTVDKEWNADNFDHSKTDFPLEGKHKEVDCKECHKSQLMDGQEERIEYKIEKFECKDCHSS